MRCTTKPIDFFTKLKDNSVIILPVVTAHSGKLTGA